MKKFDWIIISVFSLFFLACNKSEKRIKPEIKPIVEAVYASGKLLPEEGHKVFAMNDGIILQQIAEEGRAIKKGDIIFQIDASNQDSRLQTAKETFKIANENFSPNSPILSELKSQMESARIKFVNDSINFERYKSLWLQNVGAKNEFDKATLTYKLSKYEYENTQKRLKKTKNQLFLDLQNAKMQLDLATKDMNFTHVTSDIDGILFETYKKQGEAVRRNDPVAYVGKATSFYLQLWIDEEDVNKVKPGQKAVVSIDMNKGKIYDAVITKIYPILTSENQSVKVEAKFVNPMEDWLANASAEVNIIISQKDKAITIPKSLLVNNDSVWIEKNNTISKIKITKGIETFDFVEIVSGVDANTTLIEK